MPFLRKKTDTSAVHPELESGVPYTTSSDLKPAMTSLVRDPFFLLVTLFELGIVAFHIIFTKYSTNVATDLYPYYQDVHVMIFVGFG
jgi:hypothetical protein